MKDTKIDPRVFDLYDEYCHGRLDRRDFLSRSKALALAGGLGLAMAESLLPDYARAETVSFNDPRIRPRYVEYPSPGGTSGAMRGYLVSPAAAGPFPAVLVIHENRGLNPYVKDVARRVALDGFVALAPDGLSSVGGYPGNDDDGRTLQRGLDQQKLRRDMLNGARILETHSESTGKLGAVGFCWGGGTVNYLATEMGTHLKAAVPFYGSAPDANEVPRIAAAVMVQSAENDERVNAQWPAYEAALKAAKVRYERHLYPGTRHGFHNDSTPRHDAKAADLAWKRTIAFFRKHLA